jgi:protein SCO1/2
MKPLSPRAQPDRPSRRKALLAAAAAAAWCASPSEVRAHDRFGIVNPPQAAPPVAMTSIEGQAVTLDGVLSGRVTALQLMFTGCSATCPIQGAVFAEVQRHLAQAPRGWRLLSVSIDPLGDDPKALRTWLQRHGALAERWQAAVCTAKDLDRLLDFVRGRASGADRHTPQVYLFDARARLCYRTIEMPSPVAIAKSMQQIATPT